MTQVVVLHILAGAEFSPSKTLELNLPTMRTLEMLRPLSGYIYTILIWTVGKNSVEQKSYV